MLGVVGMHPNSRLDRRVPYCCQTTQAKLEEVGVDLLTQDVAGCSTRSEWAAAVDAQASAKGAVPSWTGAPCWAAQESDCSPRWVLVMADQEDDERWLRCDG